MGIKGWKDEEVRRLAQVAQREGFKHPDEKVGADLLAIRDLLYDAVVEPIKVPLTGDEIRERREAAERLRQISITPDGARPQR